MHLATVKKIIDDLPLELMMTMPYSLATRFVVFPFGVSTVEAPMQEPGCHIAKGDPIGPMFWYVSPDSRLSYPQEYWLHPGDEDLVIYAEHIGGQNDYYKWGHGTLSVFRRRPGYSRYRVRVELYPNRETAKYELALSLQRSLIAAVDLKGCRVVEAPKRSKYRWRLIVPGKDRDVQFNVSKTAYHWTAVQKVKDEPKIVSSRAHTLTQMIRAVISPYLFDVAQNRRRHQNER